MTKDQATEKLIYHDLLSCILDVVELQQAERRFNDKEIYQIEAYRDMLSSVLDLEETKRQKEDLLEAAQ